MKDNKVIQKAAAVAIALALWQIVSMIVGMEMLLASPVQVIGRFFKLCFEGEFWYTVFYSLIRIMGGFLIAFVVGTFAAIMAGRFKIVETLLWPYVVAIKSVPVASFIILCLIWVSFNQLTVIIAFLIAFPVVYSNVLQGIKSTDKNMIEMADIYGVPWNRKLLYIFLPSIKPYLISACSIGIGMSWKAGVAAEVIGVVKGSIGAKLYDAKIYFQNADLLAWTITIIILSIVLEKLFTLILRTIYKGVEKL